jgi:membrane dipeptidase
MENMNINPTHCNLNSKTIWWDAHGCPSLKIGSDLSFLNRYKNSGINFVSLNVGFDLISQNETIELIKYFQQWIKNNSNNYAIITNITELTNCINHDKLAIAFDIEGCNILNDQLEMVSYFYSLGVKQLSFAYNLNNNSGGGCLDEDKGLTNFGKQLVIECNKVGMVIDCSHVGYKTSMEIIELSKSPIVFSHSNPAKLVNHPRNISDEQIKACKEINGVIGINGIGIFLGENDIRSEKIVEHIDYVAQLIGSAHVGIGLDCIFNPEEAESFVKTNPTVFPKEHGFHNVSIAQPEQFHEISDLLFLRGYCKNDVDNILGDNFFRIAKSVWK